MGVLSDGQFVRRLTRADSCGLVIEPYAEATKVPGKVSWGQSSYGYDIRLGRRYVIFSNIMAMVVDPLTLEAEIEERKKKGQYVEHEGDYCLIPPNSFVLAESLEYVEIPRDCLAIVLGKSTYARCGITLNMTPLEPEWKGKITIEISNMNCLPAKVHSNQGIAQMILLRGDEVCRVSYADKPGAMYQNQSGLTLPKA